MKRFLASLAAVTMTAFAANVTFQADFEGTLEAFAKGNKIAPTTMDTVGMFDKGITGKGVKVGPWLGMMTPETTETADRNFGYNYPINGCASTERGAVSFWVKPVDWDGSNGTNHRMFINLMSAQGGYQFVIYKVLSQPHLYIYCISGGKNSGQRIGSLVKWKKDEWHNVVFNWDNGAFCTFVDGEVTGNGTYTPMKGEFARMRVGSIKWAYEVGASVMDEIRLFDAPLSPDEAKGLFNKTLNITRAPSIIGVAKSSPKVDGVVAPGEYSFTGTGFMNISGIGLSERQSKYALAHDGKRLYLAVTTPLAKEPQFVKGRGRDSELWLDENVEWHLYVPDKGQFQFIINPEGAIYDSLDRNAFWNSESFVCKSTIKDGQWTFECSLALEELGCAKDNLSMNIARSFRSPDLNTCIGAVKRNMGFADKTAFINIRLLDKQIAPVSMEDFQLSPNNLKLDVTSAEPFDGKVTCSKGLQTVFEKKSTGAKFNATTDKFIGGTSIIVKVAKGEDVIYQNEFALANDSEKPLTLHYLYTELDTEEIVFKCSSFYPDDARGTLHLVFSDLKGNKVAEKDYPLKGLGMTFNLTFPGASLAHGYYAIKGTHVAPGGEESVVIEEDWCRPEKHDIPDYLSTDYIKIQSPWTPLTQKGNAIDALLKHYEFNDGFLLSKVTANGNNILGAPMRLEVNGKSDCTAKPAFFDNHGDFCFINQEADYNGIKVATRSRMDYDGLVKVVMTITPPEGGCQLSSLKLVMPFDAKNMHYINGNGSHGNGPEKSGLLNDKPWTTNLFSKFSFWIGNLNSGFSWAAVNLKGWHCQNAMKSVEIKPEGNLRTAYLNIVDIPFKFDKPRTIEFGIMASPCRPESRKVNRMLMRDWQMWWWHNGKYFDYIDPNYTKPRKAGKMVFPYNSIGTAGHCPHWNYYQKEWNRRGIGAYAEDHPITSRAQRDRAHWIYSCLNTQTFMDFKLHQIINAIHNKEMDIHNLYFDLVAIGSCPSEEHGCAWTDDFNRKWGSCDWEYRRAFFQIIRKELLKEDPEGLISFHSHNQRLPMITSFCDIQVGGEDFVTELGARGNYYDLVDSDVLRSYSVSFGLGPKCVFIPQFARSLTFTAPGTKFVEELPKNRKAVRHLLVMLAIHDIDHWYGTPEAFALSAYLKSFGWDENVFMEPFWNTEGYFTILNDPTNGKFYVTIYRREGRFLLMALNDSPKEAEAVIKLDLKRLLGKQPVAIKDFYEPERKHVLDGDVLKLKLQDREPAILWFE